MTNTLPLRRTILHLAQRFRMDGDTFITMFSLQLQVAKKAKVVIIHVHFSLV